MYVIDVIPFAAGAPAGALSYRANQKTPIGAVVEVTLRGKRIRGVVMSCESVRDAKASLKNAGFALKSGKLAKQGLLPPALMKAAQDVALYHAAPVGSVLSSLLSETLPDEIPKLVSGPGFKKIPMECIYQERLEKYKSLSAKEFRSGRSVLLVAPTVIELARLAETFAEFKPVVLSGALKGLKREAALAAAVSAKLVIATPAFMWTPVAKLGAVILERASAGSYVFQKRPYLDARVAAQALAEAREVSFVLGDYPLPIEWRIEPVSAPATGPSGTVRIIDMRKARLEGEKFKAVPDEIMLGIGSAIANGGRAAVLAVRKGYSPAVVCRTCGSAVRDKEGRSLAFSTARGERVFRSADGSVVESAERVCDVCGSWNLMPLGIGVERVAEEIKEALPDARIVQIDADTVRTPAQVKRAAQAARESGTVIIGTELMLPFFDPSEPLEYAAIASADSLLALPFWRARERLVHAGLTLRNRAAILDVATRRPEDAAFTALRDADQTFFIEENGQREQFSYPPYGHLLRIRALVSPTRRETAAREILDALSGHTAIRMPDRKAKNKIAVTIVLKLPKDAWPDAHLSNALASLPPSVTTLIDSESLW
jgi:primosomal protein N' (replication factor Y)